MTRIVAFYYDWPNTAGNHAGMAYFARQFRHSFNHPVILIHPPRQISGFRWRVAKFWRSCLVAYLSRINKPDDIFLFLDYLGDRRTGDQRAVALDLRARGLKNRMVGLVHLPGNFLTNLYSEDYIRSALTPLDQILVFGSSLAEFINGLGFEGKVRSTFYYVDTDFYQPSRDKPQSKPFTVLHMGSLMRNREMLREIASLCPEVHFEICMGNSSFETIYSDIPNVTALPFLSEQHLLRKMQLADISLSVFNDTVGSNVIVTSMACGLPQVVSDVGSIRDYCSEDNTIFCNTVEEFVEGIHKLYLNPQLRKKMSVYARRRAEELSLSKSLDWFEHFLLES